MKIDTKEIRLDLEEKPISRKHFGDDGEFLFEEKFKTRTVPSRKLVLKLCDRIDELEKSLFDLRHRADFKGVDDVNEFIYKALEGES